MPTASIYRGVQNSYNTPGNASNPYSITGGTVPDNQRIIDISKYAESLSPTKTPILTALGKPGTRDQRLFYFGQKGFPPHVTTLAADIDDNDTALTVATGDGSLIQKNSLLIVLNKFAGSNPARYDFTTLERLWVHDNPTADSIPVTRAMGGSTGIAHLAGAQIQVLPPHEPQNQDHTISPVVRGVQWFNNFARIAGGVKMDNSTRHMPTYENNGGDQLLLDMATETERLKLLLEKTVIYGGRQSGHPTTPLPEMFGGLLYFIQTNVYNQASQTLSIPQLETALYDLWNKVDDSAAKRLLMSMNTARIFDTFLNPYRQATMSETQATFFTNRVKLRSGTYDIGESRWMPDGVIAIVDFSEMELLYFSGMGWHTTDHPVNGDYSWRSISADVSMEIRNENAMGILYNFDTDLDLYAGRQFLT